MPIPKSKDYAAIVNGKVAFIGSKRECRSRSLDVRDARGLALGKKAPALTGPTDAEILASIRQIIRAGAV